MHINLAARHTSR